LDQSRRKCRPSTSRSVVTTTRPSGAASTAASSPGPSSTFARCVNRPVMRLITPNSPKSPILILHLRVLSMYGGAPVLDAGERLIAREGKMVQAYILIQTEVGKAAEVARKIAAIAGVTQAEDVTGPYDVIVRAEARDVDELGKLGVARIQAVEGITRTLTCPIVHI